jgi:hypothetical protein
VARGKIENTEASYKSVTGTVNNARLAGLMDWDAIEDRTRAFIRRARWSSANAILKTVAKQYHMDMWHDQPCRIFVIVEKEALAGVLEGVCHEFDIPLLAARGYPSGTVLREFTLTDIVPMVAQDQTVVLLHLGDHDPSGIDMSRDLTDRLLMFSEREIKFKRIALNMPQIKKLNPPPNPAKTKDPRFKSYQKTFGEESWELDALQPDYLAQLVRTQAEAHIDARKWNNRMSMIKKIKRKLDKVAKDFK